MFGTPTLVIGWNCRTGHYFTGDHTTYLVPKQEGFILAMTDDGSRWMYKLDNGCILVRNVITGTDEHMVDGLTCRVSTAQFNKHGTHILAAMQNNTVRVWSLEQC